MRSSISWRAVLVFSIAAAFLGLSAGPANAAMITYDGYASWTRTTGVNTYDASGSDKLVVAVAGEHHFSGNTSGDVLNITYNGQALIKAVEQSPSSSVLQTTADIWYLDNPSLYTGAGTIVVSFNGNSWCATAIGLSGTAEGVGATANVFGTASVNLTTTAFDSMVIAALGGGGSGNTASPAPPAVSPMTPISGIVFPSNYTGLSTGYQSISSPSLQTYSFNTALTDVVTIAAEFLAFVPTLYWDIDGVTPGAGGVDGDKPFGTWDTSANWNDKSDGTGAAQTWSAGYTARFAAGTNATGAYTVTVDGTHDITGLAFEEGTVTLTPATGGGALQMTGNTLMNVASGLTATVEIPISEDGEGLTPRQLSKVGDGTLVLSGANDYTGGTGIVGGIVAISGSGTLGAGGDLTLGGGALDLGGTIQTVGAVSITAPPASGDTIANGSITATSYAASNAAATTVVVSANLLDGSTSTMTKSGAGILVLTGNNTYDGMTSINAGALVLGKQAAINGGLTSITPTNVTVESGAALGLAVGDSAGLFDAAAVGTVLSQMGTSTATTGMKPGAQIGLDTTNATGGTFTYSSVIGDLTDGNSLGLAKLGEGQLVLDAANTYTGATTVYAGTLTAGAGKTSAFGSTPSLAFGPGSAGTVQLNGNDTTFSSLTSNGGSPIIENGGTADATLTLNNSADTTYAGVLQDGSTGTLGLTKGDVGTLILLGANTYTGDTAVTGGKLQIGSNNAASLGGGTYAGNISLAGGTTLAVWSSINQTLSGDISGDGDVTKGYGGTLTLSGDNTYTGQTSIRPQTTAGGNISVSSFNSVNGGTPLMASSSLGCPTTEAKGTIDLGAGNTQAGVTLIYTGPGETTDRVINLVGNGNGPAKTIQADGTGLLKFTSPFIKTAGSTALGLSGTGSGEIVGALPAFDKGLVKSGAGTWTIDAAGIYTGATQINGGTLIVKVLANGGSASGIGLSTNVAANLMFGNGGTLKYVGAEVSTDRLFTLNGGNTSPSTHTIDASGTGPISFTNIGNMAYGTATKKRTLILTGTNTGDNTLSAAMANNGTEVVSLTKNGVGTWVLAGAKTYTGATTINGGLLKVTGSTASGSAVAVNNNGALGGTGTVGGAVTVSGTGGIKLTDGSVGILTLGSDLAITGAAGANNLYFDLGATDTGTDKITVAGNTSVTTAGAAVINLNQIGGVATPITAGTYDLIATTGTMDTIDKFALGTTKAFGEAFSLQLDSDTSKTLQVVVGAGPAGPAAPAWTGGTSTSWAATGNWTGEAIPGYESNVTFYDTAANLSTELNEDFDINSLNYGTGATSATTIAKGTAGMLTIEAYAANGNTAGNGITVNSTSGTHTISANVGLASSQTWTVAAGGTLDVSGVVSDFVGGYSLTKAGDGTLILSGANTYSGGTTVAGGKLLVNNTSGAGAVTVANATDNTTATLGGTGTISGAVTVSAAGEIGRVNLITGGDIGTTGTLNISGGLTFEAGAIGYFDIVSDTDKDYLNVTGALTAASGTIIRVSTTAGFSGDYGLIGYTGTSSDIGNYTLQGLDGGAVPVGYSLSYGTNVLKLVVIPVTWTGEIDTDWNVAGNWNYVPTAADTPVFGSSMADPSGAVDLGSTDQVIAGINFQSTVNTTIASVEGKTLTITTGNVDVQGGIHEISASIADNGGNGLTKTGAGTLVLSGENAYAGNTLLKAGTLQIAELDNLGTSNVTFQGGTLQYATGSEIDVSGRINSIGSGQVAKIDTNGNDVAFGTAITGDGGLSKLGDGTLTLSVAGNTFGGSVTVSTGGLTVAGGATVTISGEELIVSNGGTMVVSGTVNIAANNWTYCRVGVGGALATPEAAIILQDSGKLNAENSFVIIGDRGLNDGKLTIQDSAELNTAIMLLGLYGDGVKGTVIQEGGTVNLTHADNGLWFTSPALQIGSPAMFTGGTWGNGRGEYHLDGGTLIAHSIGGGGGANGSSSKFYFNGGILKPTVNDEDVALELAGMASPKQTLFMQYLTQVVVQEGGAIIDTDGHSITIAQNLEHDPAEGAPAKDGGLTKLGEGTLILTGVNTYTGDTTVSAGTLILAEVEEVPGQFKFVITGTGLTTNSNKITGGGAVQLDGDFIFDMDAAGVTLGDKWIIVDNATLAETFSETFTVVDFTGGEGAGVLWSKPITSSKIYEFSEITGILRVALTLPGDTNEDGVVDAADYIALKANFGMTEGATLAQGNFDAESDGNVDWDDLQILMANFGTRTIGGAPAIPEPATLGLLAIGALAVIRRRRK